MAHNRKNQPDYKGNLPISMVSKLGAMRTKLLVLKGKKAEVAETGQDTT